MNRPVVAMQHEERRVNVGHAGRGVRAARRISEIQVGGEFITRSR